MYILPMVPRKICKIWNYVYITYGPVGDLEEADYDRDSVYAEPLLKIMFSSSLFFKKNIYTLNLDARKVHEDKDNRS